MQRRNISIGTMNLSRSLNIIISTASIKTCTYQTTSMFARCHLALNNVSFSFPYHKVLDKLYLTAMNGVILSGLKFSTHVLLI